MINLGGLIMKEYRYEIEDKRIISLQYIEGHTHIKEYMIKDGTYQDYLLLLTDDYGFYGYCEDNVDEIYFIYNEDHPLYTPFLHLLGDSDKFRILNDYKREEYDELCYIDITRVGELIELKFVNKIEKDKNDIDKFNFIVISIFDDLRSKTWNTDSKDRIHRFFNEAIEVLKDDKKVMQKTLN